MLRIADRLNNVKEYYFSIKLREVRDLISQGKPIINLGIGSPDLNPPEEVISALKNADEVILVDIHTAGESGDCEGLLSELKKRLSDTVSYRIKTSEIFGTKALCEKLDELPP